MTEIRNALETVGRRFPPPDHSAGEVIREAPRRRRRRVTGLTLALVLGGLPLAAGAYALLATPPDCPPVAEGGYRLTMAPSAGGAGTEVLLSGPVPLLNEDGSFDGTDDHIEFWWNVDPNQWDTALTEDPSEAVAGQSVFLGTEELGDSCRFEFVFEVPDGEAGSYPVMGLTVGGDGATIYDARTFQLTD